jgi:hypothetical protein
LQWLQLCTLKTLSLLSRCSSITPLLQPTLQYGIPMASQFLPTSTETSHGAHQLPEPAHVQPHIVQAPPSPPLSVKKMVSIFSPSSFEDHDSQRKSPRCSAIRILSFQGPRRARLRLFYILAAFFILFCWWRSRTVQDFKSLKQRANNLKKNLLLPPLLNDLHFVPASHQHIHVGA